MKIISAVMPSKVIDIIFYDKEEIVCLGLSNGSIVIFKLQVESSDNQSSELGLKTIDFKSFSKRNLKIAETNFLCSDNPKAPAIFKKISIIPL
jgi:hypothetical protein